MLVDPDIFYILMVADWRPHEVSPFQGFAPNILDHTPTLQKLVRLPGDVFEYTMPREDRLARRTGGRGGWRWAPFNASSLPDLSMPLTSPMWVLFSANPDVAAAVETWRQGQIVRPLHVGLNGIQADCRLDILTVDILADHCRQALTAAKAANPNLEIGGCLKAIDHWVTPAEEPSPLVFASHNVSTPNEMVLLSEG
jgi:hypothetical protein